MAKQLTTEIVDAEIAALKDLLPRVRSRNVFGDDHRDAIRAQITVLEQRMDMDAIYVAWGDEDTEEYAHNVLEAAQIAHDWYTQLSDEPAPSVGWAELAA